MGKNCSHYQKIEETSLPKCCNHSLRSRLLKNSKLAMQQPQRSAQILRSEWREFAVEYGRLEEVGEFDLAMPKQAISVAFVPHDRVSWSVDGARIQTTALPAGSVFLYADRQFVWHRREKPSEYVNLTLEPQLLDRVAAENNLSAPIELEHRVIFLDPTILQIAQLLKSEVVASGIAGDLYVESLRNLLAVHLLRNYTGASTAPAIEPGLLDVFKLKQVKDYIAEHLAEALTIADLAALIPMSSFHFARAFKAAIGMPPHQYITQQRIDRAKILLSATQLSIAEISYQVGFSNQSHFTAQFRKQTGATPKQYRESA